MAKKNARKAPGDQLRAWLTAQTHEHLVDLLCSHADGDPGLRQRLELEAAAQRVGGLDAAPFLAALDRAIVVTDFVDEDEVATWAHRLGEVLCSVGDLLEQGHAQVVVDLMEHAQRRMQDAVERVDDDGFHIDGLLYDIEALHLEACRSCGLAPEELAARLLELEIGSEYGFAGALDRYAAVLGEQGVAAYRELVEAEWAQVPARGPGENPPFDRRRSSVGSIMATLAEHSGNLEERVCVASRDLSGPHRFVAIAEMYREAGSQDEALAWAERGLKAFGGSGAGPKLAGLVIDGYLDRGRHSEAMSLAVAEFDANPTSASYSVLKARATRAGEWDQRREPARAALRKAAPPPSSPGTRQPPWSQGTGRTALVRALLEDGEAEQAWQEAVEGGCADPLWLELAATREAEHPEDAIEVYRTAVDHLVPLKDKDAYRKAAALAVRIAGLMAATGREADWASYIAALRAAHRPKRNLMAALDQAGL